jgi:crotonobetainyl-CoA:carnitine CoA-transferase CaiB-like acyl-CoA transferase
MNQLDILLESLVSRYAADLGLTEDRAQQMVREIAICAIQGYNTRAELITLVKSAMVAA